MANYNAFEFLILQLFDFYLKKQIDDQVLIKTLRKMEDYLRLDSEMPQFDMWFRFGKDDPLVTLIHDLESDLKSSNRDYRIETMQRCVETNYIKVNFS